MTIIVDKLIKSKRKTVSLIINAKGELIVRAPLKFNEKELPAILADKKEWIEKHQTKNAKRGEFKRDFSDGAELPFMNEKRTLKVVDGVNFGVKLYSGTILVNRDILDNVEEYIELIYRDYTKTVIFPKAAKIAAGMNIIFNKFKITGANTRWGSCSSKGNININWKLAMAPEFVVDYIIIHELMHIFEMNHSDKFWNLVEKAMPDYMIAEKWLKEFGHTLKL